MNRINSAVLAVSLVVGLAAGCARSDVETGRGDSPAASAPAPVAAPAAGRAVGETFTIDSGRPGVPGIEAEVLAVGSGEPCGKGRRALIHYVGTHLDGTKFDSSRDRGEPFPVDVGGGGVIAGWDIIAAKMRVGDRWKVHIPYQLAYGERGHPAGIPPRSDLLFDMEMMEIR